MGIYINNEYMIKLIKQFIVLIMYIPFLLVYILIVRIKRKINEKEDKSKMSKM